MMKTKILLKRMLINKTVFCVLFISLFLSLSAFCDNKIAVVISGKSEIFNEVLEGFKFQIQQNLKGVKIEELILTDKNSEKIQAKLTEFTPDYTLTIGRPAALLLFKMIDIPFVYTMVYEPLGSHLIDAQGNNLCLGSGIKPVISAEIQLAELKKVISKTAKVGILYGEEFSKFIESAQAAASKQGIIIESQLVADTYEASKNFRVLSKKGIDTFWLLPDSTVLTEGTESFYFGICKISGINVLSFDSKHLKSQAAVVVTPNFGEMGQQAAGLVIKGLNGEIVRNEPLIEPVSFRTLIEQKNIQNMEY
ncbi:MAG: hypothetical protein ACD_79C00455G0001 [uncultured bacterium]|nr:MAG: hypothetical protein ACD_79C00455G0001 [uncultured bacterium]